MREHLYILRGWLRAFQAWAWEPWSRRLQLNWHLKERKERKQRALRAAQKVLR